MVSSNLGSSSPAASLATDGNNHKEASQSAASEVLESYNILNEAAPNHRFFSLDFQDAINKGIKIARETVKAIEDSGSILKHSALASLLEDAKRLTSFQPSSHANTKTFAVLGDSGLGKSSLINSLLHCPGISKTGDMGSACTSVVTEFRQKLDTQTEKIAIEVEYLSQSEIEYLVAELLWSFQKLHQPGMEEDEADYDACAAESANAWSALEAAFGHHEGFNEDLLKDTSSLGHTKAKNQLVRWCRMIEWPRGGDGSIWADTAKTAEECCEKTDVFLSNQLWPFTKMIRIYLDSPVLQNGIVLADLPGLQDTNLARVRVTQAYLLKCSNILLVTNISRAVTDRSLNKSLFKLISSHVPIEWDKSATGDIKIAIVCTKIDASSHMHCEINETRAKQNLALLKEHIDLSLLGEIEAGIADARDKGYATRAKELKKRRKILFVQARNQHVKRGLQQAYASKIPGQNLDVFCVSNKWYEKHSQDGNKAFVEASGIIELRNYCRVASADVHLREASHFLGVSLPNLLNSVKMYGNGITSPPAMQKIQAAFDDTERALTDAILSFTEDLASCFDKHIFQTAEDRNSSWLDAAERQWTEWNQWHHAQFRAWCRNNGNHATPTRGQKNWNADIISQMRTETRPLWNIVEENISHLVIFFYTAMRNALKELEDVVIAKTPSHAHDALTGLIENQIKNTSYILFKIQENFKDRVRSLRQSVLETNANSYVLKQMLQTYRTASVMSGVGSSRLQKDLVRSRLTDRQFFTTFFERLAEELSQDMKKIKQELRGELSHAISETRRGIDMAVSNSRLPGTSRLLQELEQEKLLKKIRKLHKQADEVAKAVASA